MKPTPVPTFESDSDKETTAFKVLRVEPDCSVVLEVEGEEVPIRLIGVVPATCEGSEDADQQEVQELLEDLIVG